MPNLLFFNPGCELEVASGLPRYSLQKYPALLESDLSTLPVLMARPGDYVAGSTSDLAFSDYWCSRKQCHLAPFGHKDLLAQQFCEYRPWGISPRALHLAGGLNFSQEYLGSPCSTFTTAHRMLFSRESSAALIRHMASQPGYPDCCTGKSELPEIARSMDQVKEFLGRASESQCHGAVLKAIFGSSGRGIRMLRSSHISGSIGGWAQSMIKSHGAIECEYLFDKACDFSMHYDIKGGNAEFRGVSLFKAAGSGAYQCSLAKRLGSIPGFSGISAGRLSEIHISALRQSVYCQRYQGPLGIDCMVYRSGGALMVNPCIEVNCRHSMGRLAMEISPLVADGSAAYFHVYKKDEPLEEFSIKPAFSNGKLESGFLPLTPADTQVFAAGLSAKKI